MSRLLAVLLMASPQGEAPAPPEAIEALVLREDGAWARTAIDPVEGARGAHAPGVVAIVAVEGRRAADAEPYAIVLSSGEVFPGAPRTTVEGVRWRHPWLGELAIPENGLRGVRFGRDAAMPDAEGADVLLLRNGDRIRGFLSHLQDPLVMEREDGGELVVPLDRALAVGLVHKEAPAGPVRMWFADGTVLDSKQADVAPEGIRFSGTRVDPDGGSGILPHSELLAVVWEPSRVVPVAALPVTVGAASEATLTPLAMPKPRHSAEGAPLDAADIRLDGPARYAFLGPDEPTRLAALVSLPPEVRGFAELDLVVRDTSGERARVRLDQKNPEAALGCSLLPGLWSIEVTEGRNGPVGDSVILRQAVLLRAPRG